MAWRKREFPRIENDCPKSLLNGAHKLVKSEKVWACIRCQRRWYPT